VPGTLLPGTRPPVLLLHITQKEGNRRLRRKFENIFTKTVSRTIKNANFAPLTFEKLKVKNSKHL
jgi:hypothetical protein